MIALWLLACSHPTTTGPADTDPKAPAVLRDWLDGASTAGGTLVLQAQSDQDVKVDVPTPSVDGLSFVLDGKPRVEHIGDQVVVTERFAFTGPQGHYEIPSLVASWAGKAGSGTATTTPVYVDLGVASPRNGELTDIAEPSRVWGVPWLILGVGVGALALVGGGVALAFGRRKTKVIPALPPESPDVIALRAWELLRKKEVTDHEKALGLSMIFREYVEAALRFPATSWTTTETLEHLRGLSHLPEGNVPRAKRLLRATDRIKYAEATIGGDLFDELDSDLRAFVASTRPQRWQGT